MRRIFNKSPNGSPCNLDPQRRQRGAIPKKVFAIALSGLLSR